MSDTCIGLEFWRLDGEKKCGFTATYEWERVLGESLKNCPTYFPQLLIFSSTKFLTLFLSKQEVSSSITIFPKEPPHDPQIQRIDKLYLPSHDLSQPLHQLRYATASPLHPHESASRHTKNARCHSSLLASD